MILRGDCVEVMKAIKPNSIDAVVCDPPYGLEFMGKEWDRLSGYFGDKDSFDYGNFALPRQRKRNIKCPDCGHYVYSGTPCKCGGTKRLQAYQMQLWHTQWLTEAYRVMKPGASMLVMGGTRTFHRLMVAIEDSGFIIKDTLMWLYGSGFPKAQDLGKMIDKRAGKEREVIGVNPNSRRLPPAGVSGNYAIHGKAISVEKAMEYHRNTDPNITTPSTDLAKHWNGFKVGGIKPAHEIIVWAVKPPEGSYIDNVLKWGVGAVNVDECRIEGDYKCDGGPPGFTADKGWHPNSMVKLGERKTQGRFPANVILSHHPECEQVGVKEVSGGPWGRGKSKSKTKSWKQSNESRPIDNSQYTDKDGLETVESWNCHPDCPIKMLDEQSGVSKSTPVGFNRAISGGKGHEGYKREAHNNNSYQNPSKLESNYTDAGGASRFFYCAKASRGERNAGLEGMEEKARNEAHPRTGGGSDDWGDRVGHSALAKTTSTNNHPTVKPIALFEYLIKLVTREGQVVLDPFLGSGTTAIAAHKVGRKCVGIEREKDYIEIAKKRVEHWQSKPQQMEMGI